MEYIVFNFQLVLTIKKVKTLIGKTPQVSLVYLNNASSEAIYRLPVNLRLIVIPCRLLEWYLFQTA